MNARSLSRPLLVGLALVLIVPLTLWLIPRVTAQFKANRQLAVGYPTPDLTLTTLDGETISLRSQRGEPVVLVFVASWCEVCRAEMPMMVETFHAHQNHGLVFLAIDVMEDRAAVGKFRAEFQIPFPLLLDPDGTVAARFDVNGTPTTFFIDRAGMTRDIVIGGPLSRAYLEKEIAPLLESVSE